MTDKIFSPGKLLLTAEYFVLDGAQALAVPTKLGQEFYFEEIQDNASTIIWEAFHQNIPWLSVAIHYKNWEILKTNLPEAAAFVVKTLQNVDLLSKTKFKDNKTYRIKTNLQFPANFGLGSSSTLMNNLAEWAEIDPFELNRLSLGGSGYDIAVAREKAPILYTLKPERAVVTIDYNPSFKDEIIFIHLNKKQDSREGIKAYREQPLHPGLIEEVSEITKAVVSCGNIDEFSDLMNKHENLVSSFLKISTAKELHFKGCPVFIKSLGAWGGDFVMSRKFEGYNAWFSEKGFKQIFDYRDLIY